jgi:hypothetical protein
LVVFGFLINYAFGLEDPYRTQANRFTTKPTICVVEPSADNLSRDDIRSVMAESKASIYDWINPLQEKTVNKNKWSVNYLEISDKKSFDFSSCSVRAA